MTIRETPYRVVVWGPGYTGAQALREIARRPELQLVGCLAYSPAKVGRDAMELIGEPPIGVEVVADPQAIHDLDADVVLYAGIALPDETSRHAEITALLRGGKNVVTSTAYFFPWQRGEEYVAPLEAACAEGGTTLHGTGIHPGWFAERFALTATSLCTTVHAVHLREICDLSHHAGDTIAAIGFGRPPEQLGAKTRKTLLSRYYFECIAGLAHHLGLPVEELTAEVRYLPSTRTLQCAGVTVERGTVGALDGVWSGLVGGEPVITIRELWYLDPALVDDGVELVSGDMYEVDVRGLPVDVRTRADLRTSDARDVFGVDDRQSAANLATAVQLVQTIPAVVAAPPGILLAPGFAYPAADLRTIPDVLGRRPAVIPETIH
ncbi:hypothetical protein ABT369_09660 [Dactylosporangium sp. NPDC000244]|uniref:NAD(P)H-dependent amine dehydrogenase family protein n=1 Tax=Dactylosporangium sp. NPDC000244 TaxID=3154365 RepID=UPI003323D49D